MAVTNKFADLKTKHAIAKEYRTDEQIYIEIATAVDPGQYASMGTTEVKDNESNATIGETTGIQNIVADYSNVVDGSAVQVKVNNGTATSTVSKPATGSLGMTLPTVREYNKAWYVTKEGRVFNANGYAYNGKTYYDAKHYEEEEKGSQDTDQNVQAAGAYTLILAENGGSGGNGGNTPTQTETYISKKTTENNGKTIASINPT